MALAEREPEVKEALKILGREVATSERVISSPLDFVCTNPPTRRIKAAAPGTQVVILTIHEGDDYRADATAAGASAYVSKRAMHTDLIPTLATLLPAQDVVESEGI